MTTENTLTWTVMAVFDPDGNGGDFAYTVGLAEQGIAELHVWARPTDGDDPGADFELSPEDMGHLLNAWGAEHRDGELDVGSTFTIEFDGGAAKGHFVAGDLVCASSVDAFMAGDDTPVIPMRWSLER
ncbi:MAG TPA: hypothetical protein VL068_08415 [Microthrixaceae bacterium]|nr:hypothetical protein [Microthrixaceae bacterium]